MLLPANRIHAIDALRGFALLGILWVNIYVFNAPYAHYSVFYGAFEGVNSSLVFFSSSFVAGKFMFIFAFLFGYGAQLQSQKISDLGLFTNYWNRRMFVLAVFGLAHLIFFWFGDILLPYAILGFLIPYLLRFNPRKLFIIGLGLYLSSAFAVLIVKLFELPDPGIASEMKLDAFIRLYSSSSYMELLPYRLEEFWSLRNEKLVFYLPKELALFCFGIAAGKLKLIESYLPKTPYLLLGFSMAILWYLYRGEYFALYQPDENPLLIPVLIVQNIVFEIVLGAVYIFGFIHLCRLRVGVYLIRIFSPVGRMSLTNYFFQSLVCVVLFYGFGFGLYGSLNPMELLYISVIIFFIQTLLSHVWLSRLRQGPLELCWRILAGKKQ